MKRRLRKRISVKGLYSKSIKAISEAILSENIPNTEIDIEQYYNRSTQTLGKYVTLDWNHKKDIDNLIKTIEDYSNDYTKKRPLNIIMLAEPGLGKSHFIKCLAEKMSPIGVSAVPFNMATLQNVDDLVQPIEAVRNLKVLDRLPLLFLDEIDSNHSNYAMLLPLLWDGELHIGQRDLKLGKVVIVMAASDPQIKKIMKEAKNMQYDQVKVEDEQKKIIDLLSRINGGSIEIPGLDINTKNRDRRIDKICLTIALLQQRFGEDLQYVPLVLLRFIAMNKFRYGVRSIAHLIDFIPGDIKHEDRIVCDDFNFPFADIKELKKSSLAYHLVAEEEPDSIIEMWEEFNDCNTLIRFHSEEDED